MIQEGNFPSVYSPGGAGKRRPVMQPNYHTLSNNAVFPTGEKLDVQHFHSKVVMGNKPKLAPTLRNVSTNETAQIYDGMVSKPVNDSPQMLHENDRV